MDRDGGVVLDPVMFTYQQCMYSSFKQAVDCTLPWLFEGLCGCKEKGEEEWARYMLGIIPPSMGGDVKDWAKGDESETMVHNMVSTSIVHGSHMPINLSLLAMLLPCSTYDRRRCV